MTGEHFNTDLRKDLSLHSLSSSIEEGWGAWRIWRPWIERTEGRMAGGRVFCAHSSKGKEAEHWPSSRGSASLVPQWSRVALIAKCL